MTIPTLHTPKLTLRPWTLEDAEALHQILSEPGILDYFPPSPPATLKMAQRYITHQLEHWQARGYGHWAVTGPGAAGPVLGWCGLEYLPELDETEIAYLLSHQAWGQGIATAAAQATLHFGFTTGKLKQIIGLVHPENRASIRVLEKCGLAYVDRLSLWGIELERYRGNFLLDKS
jgi:ribosomal-protein-alanine N-acetyltransferase